MLKVSGVCTLLDIQQDISIDIFTMESENTSVADILLLPASRYQIGVRAWCYIIKKCSSVLTFPPCDSQEEERPQFIPG